MRVDLGKTADTPELQQTRNSGAAATPQTTGRTQVTADTATLSETQNRVQALATQVAQLPEIRQEKVAALGRLINQGKYQVTAEQTAESILSAIAIRPAA
jgi:flagellar biosynthesis anti-sigma factor FlgM